jgi:N-acetylglucosaminyldiphosphoundecaprenol N-acetyl-beta-D-mannosaminyltransferase
METAESLIATALQNRCQDYICVTGVHGIMEAQKDAGLRDILNRSFLTTPDGVPTVWMGRLQGHSNMGRVFGPDLMMRICEGSQTTGHTHFFYGGEPGVAQELQTRLQRRFPRLRIVGAYTPPFRPLTTAEEAQVVELVAQVSPDIIWVGLSTPKQERFMAEYIRKFEARLMIGVGAAFDYHTGRIKDAPDWVKHAGLQWLHRLAQNPRRLWKRYLFSIPPFLLRTAAQLAGLKKYPELWLDGSASASPGSFASPRRKGAASRTTS